MNLKEKGNNMPCMEFLMDPSDEETEKVFNLVMGFLRDKKIIGGFGFTPMANLGDMRKLRAEAETSLKQGLKLILTYDNYESF